jgi:two-component system OmpR family response regulator
MKILIVEDDSNYRAMLFEHLNSQGHDVLAVSDALHAVALLNEKDSGIEIALMDLNMPRLSGEVMMKTFAKWVRCRTRFIVMSGEAAVSEYENHPSVVGCLDKPFSLEALSDLMKAAEVTADSNLAASASQA